MGASRCIDGVDIGTTIGRWQSVLPTQLYEANYLRIAAQKSVSKWNLCVTDAVLGKRCLQGSKWQRAGLGMVAGIVAGAAPEKALRDLSPACERHWAGE